MDWRCGQIRRQAIQAEGRIVEIDIVDCELLVANITQSHRPLQDINSTELLTTKIVAIEEIDRQRRTHRLAEASEFDDVSNPFDIGTELQGTGGCACDLGIKAEGYINLLSRSKGDPPWRCLKSEAVPCGAEIIEQHGLRSIAEECERDARGGSARAIRQGGIKGKRVKDSGAIAMQDLQGRAIDRHKPFMANINSAVTANGVRQANIVIEARDIASDRGVGFIVNGKSVEN